MENEIKKGDIVQVKRNVPRNVYVFTKPGTIWSVYHVNNKHVWLDAYSLSQGKVIDRSHYKILLSQVEHYDPKKRIRTDIFAKYENAVDK